MMLHQDGSRHEWTPGRQWDLIVTLDDATSEVYSAFFVAEEGAMSSFRALHEVTGAHRLFCSLYTDHDTSDNETGGYRLSQPYLAPLAWYLSSEKRTCFNASSKPTFRMGSQYSFVFQPSRFCGACQ